MAYTATPEQEVWLLKHRVWNRFDDGLTADQVTDSLVDDGYPPPIVAMFVAQHAENVQQSTHSQEQRTRIVDSVRTAIEQADEDQILACIDQACDDDRTLYRTFSALSHLLFGPEPHCRWAAFGLSKMIGFGDFALAQALEHENELNRLIAAFALGTMGAEAINTVEALEEAANDSSELVRQAAADSLNQIRHAQQE